MASSSGARYYDVIVIGKTGLGKSTLGNKLLQVADYPLSYFRRYISCDKKAEVAEGSVREEIFRTSEYMSDASDDKIESVTQGTELVVNEETAVRVLDTQGFADTRKTSDLGLYKANLQCFRNIAREQADKNLQVRRVLYFFPQRGTPERVDGVLQEELKVMYYFFGEEIFKCMAIVATLDKSATGIIDMQQQFVPEDVRKQILESYYTTMVSSTSKVLASALEKVTQKKYEKIPPIIVTLQKEKGADVVDKVKKADVIEEKVFVPMLMHNTCAQCAARIVFSTKKGGKEVPIGIKEKNGIKPLEETNCHPCFMPKYSTGEKVVGGVAHVATAGIPYTIADAVFNKKLWPGFTNSDEICVSCKKSPESEGCTLLSENEKLHHTNRVRRINKHITDEAELASILDDL